MKNAYFGSRPMQGNRRGAASAPVAGSVATVAGFAPSVHYHPHSAAMMNFSSTPAVAGDWVALVQDRMTLASLTGNSSSDAPLLAVDALERKYLNFRSGAYMLIANALASLNSQAITVILVGRPHKCRAANFFYPRWRSDGTTANSARAGAMVLALPTGGTACFLASGPGTSFSSAAVNKEKFVPGSQLQVMGMCSRTTANGGMRYGVNGDISTFSAAVQQTALTGMMGGVVGATPAAAGAVTQVTTTGFDLYEMMVYSGTLTDAQFDAAMAAATANWAIPAITRQLVLEGDSITDGVGDVQSDESLSAVLTRPGAEMVAGDCRVINLATSGNMVSHLVTRRDGTISMFDQLLGSGEPARNLVAVQIGRNHWPSQTGAQAYAELVPLLNTTTTGYLQRGWSVAAVVNIAPSAALIARCNEQRALMLSSLLTDTLSGPGQSFEGRVSLLRLDLAGVGGQTRFEDSADATNLTYYQNDTTHPSAAGTAAMASGGDNGAYGYGALM
ncbi:SGNH/GDSL hydrolase family protein [Sphingobium sufflavum]|uniref:SGNH/GDSL hydrolase family protein n=1 Tax=Sphingobium sufflavum TaxID=1129547 RepID=UPI001F168729|nr:SGNH/GDSL hydrolase family protein [Sphingobium sufflavum]MCE7798538.1 SGNH/GDSL hydrolase family protein [Sphingobium sufflavum]